MTQPNTNYFRQGIQERRRRDIDRIGDMTVKDSTVSGRHLVIGAGEAQFDVGFPVTFARKPTFTFGGELNDNFVPTTGRFPTVSAVVLRWQSVGQVAGAVEGYFIGATIGVVTDGDATQEIWVHWSFRAPGLRNPVQANELPEDTI